MCKESIVVALNTIKEKVEEVVKETKVKVRGDNEEAGNVVPNVNPAEPLPKDEDFDPLNH